MSKPFEVIETAQIQWFGDTPVSESFDDVYFSKENALGEIAHVFVNGNNLIARWQAISSHDQSPFVIAETGFGTGLNFLHSWKTWKQYAPLSAHLHFISCEKHPLTKEDLHLALKRWPELATETEQLIQQYPILTPGFHHLIMDNGRIKLTLMLGDIIDSFQSLLYCGEPNIERDVRRGFVDAWFLDGFAPKKNPDMWTPNLYSIMAKLSKSTTTVATFTAAGVVKRGLEAAGFNVTKQPGFGRKREHISATFVKDLTHGLPKTTPWHMTKPIVHKSKQAMILGAGLSGSHLAYALAERGWQVTLIDKHAQPGNGASGNTQAVLFPVFSPFRAPLTEFHLSAYLFATRLYKSILKQTKIGELNGILKLDENNTNASKVDLLSSWLIKYPELGRFVDAEEGSKLSGVSLSTGGLFIPESGWINSQALCHWLTAHDNIQFVSQDVHDIHFESGLWHLGKHHAPCLILANGHHANQFEMTEHLPIKPIRGQLTWIKSNAQSQQLKRPICAKGHVLPALNGSHLFGATYGLGDDNECCLDSDDALNLEKLTYIKAHLNWSQEVVGHWAGVRAVTPDYLPLVGPVAIKDAFNHSYSKLKSNAKRWVPETAPCYPSLYICSGFGSRGLTTIPLAAQWLAGFINHEINGLPNHLIQAISPMRFLFRTLIGKR